MTLETGTAGCPLDIQVVDTGSWSTRSVLNQSKLGTIRQKNSEFGERSISRVYIGPAVGGSPTAPWRLLVGEETGLKAASSSEVTGASGRSGPDCPGWSRSSREGSWPGC